MHTTLIRSALAFAVLSAALPATAQNREHQQMSAEMRMLQEQTQQLALALGQIGCHQGTQRASGRIRPGSAKAVR